MAQAPGKQNAITSKRFALFLFLAAFLVNANTLTNGWALDDTLLITQNKLTQQGFSAIPEIWSNDVFTGYLGKSGIETGGRYRPLSQTVFAVEYGIVGNDPFLGHLTNVLLYALTCVLLFKLLARIFPESGSGTIWKNIPFIASFLYALHPVHVEVVANIKSLDEILAMLFALLTAWFALASVEKNRSRNLVLSALSFFLALTAKENAISFLAVVPLVIHYTSTNVKRAIVPTAVLLIPAVLYFMLRSVALGPTPDIAWVDNFLSNPFHGATTAERIATVLLIAGKYLVLMLVPTPLTTDYYPAMIPVVGWGDFHVWLGLLVLLGSCVCAFVGVRRKHVVGFGVLYFLITFSVVSNLFFNLGTPMNDRFLFMPLAGFALVLSWGLTSGIELLRSPIAMRMGRIIIVLVLVGYAGKTFSRNREWKDDLALFSHDVTVSGNSARCNVMLGKLNYEAAAKTSDRIAQEKLRSAAQNYLERGLAIYNDYALAWGLLGALEMDRKNYRKSADLFMECLKREPAEAVALKNLAFVGRRMGEANDQVGAEKAFRMLNTLEPRSADPYLFLADALMRTNRSDSAMIVLDKLLAMQPSNADAYRMKGEISGAYLHDPMLAEQNFLKAHELDPKNLSVIDNLGVAAFQRQDHAQALTYFLQAITDGHANARRLGYVAETYRLLGDGVKAQEYLRLAKEMEDSK